MTVARDFGEIVFHCDGKKCHEYLETGTRDFKEALATLKEEGWIATLEETEWEHYCPECIGPLYKV